MDKKNRIWHDPLFMLCAFQANGNASAIGGEVADPRDLYIRFPQLKSPRRFIIDDSMFVYPEQDTSPTEIYRGPHMCEPPSNSPLPSLLEGIVTIKLGDRISTDHIVPAGDKLKYRSNVARYADFVFEVVDDSFPARAREIQHLGRANIIVAGFGYGQGSSREHAALCPMYLGVRAVLAMSIERIHRANLINYGIAPFTFENESDYEQIGQGDELIIRELTATLGRHENREYKRGGMKWRSDPYENITRSEC